MPPYRRQEAAAIPDVAWVTFSKNAAEVKALKKTKQFGLVFEEHLPETVRLPKLLVKECELVAKKRESGNQL